MTVLRADAVLLDMDGTLVDSNALVEQVWTEFALELGIEAEEVIAFAHGRPSRDTIAAFAPDAIAHWEEHIHHAEATRFHESTAIPGAVAFTQALPRGRWAVVTSALREPAHARLTGVGIEVPDVLIGAQDVLYGKPDPEGYLTAAFALTTPPERCLVFEDTDAGIQAARAAGCRAVAMGQMHTSHALVEATLTHFSGVRVDHSSGEIVITLDEGTS